MSNVLEFFVRMKDMVSGGLVRMASTAKNSFASVERDVRNVTRANDTLGSSFNELRRRISEVESRIQSSTSLSHLRQARRELAALQRQAGSHSGNLDRGGGSSGMGFLKPLMAGVSVAAISAFGASSVKAAMDFGATKKSFEVLSGSKQKGGELANTLNDLQQNTILGPEVFKSAQTLMGFGVAADKVVKIEKQLGDVSMGNKDHFEALTLAFSQTQAAGKLMGQDLLQYINAGFNPLQTMSEHWKEFGFKSATSVGQLKEMMEKGKISSESVAKAFEIATGKGGKFANMMDTISETSYGRLQILEGQFENFKINVGNALMPVAEDLMSLASNTLNWLNINKTAPQILMGERAEMDTLVTTISSYNEGSDLRSRLMSNLIAKYPEFFGKMDAEKTSNDELYGAILKVNEAYQNRIDLASSQLMFDTNKKMVSEKQSEWVRNSAIQSAIEQGQTDVAKSMMTATELAAYSVGSLFGSSKDPMFFKTQAWDAKNGMDAAIGYQSQAQAALNVQNRYKDLDKANAFAADPAAMAAQFGKDGKMKDAFFTALAEANKAAKLQQTTTGGMFNIPTLIGGDVDTNRLMKFITPKSGTLSPSKIQGGNTPVLKGTTGDNTGGESVKGITSGGQKNITINLGKLFDNIEVHTTHLNEGINEVEGRILEGLSVNA